MVRKLLSLIRLQQGHHHTEVLDCEALLSKMQASCNRGELDLSFGVVTVQPPGPAQPQPTTSQQQPQPGPSRKRQSSERDDGRGGKRKREDASSPPVVRTPAFARATSLVPAPTARRSTSSPLHLMWSSIHSVPPTVVRRPVKKRKCMYGINENNRLPCRLRMIWQDDRRHLMSRCTLTGALMAQQRMVWKCVCLRHLRSQ